MKFLKLLILVILSSNLSFAYDSEANVENCSELLNFDFGPMRERVIALYREKTRIVKESGSDRFTKAEWDRYVQLVEAISDYHSEVEEISILRFNCINAGYRYLKD